MSERKLSRTLKAYADLTRIQFGFAWPLLFSSGVMLGFLYYGGFSWETLVKAIFIALCGFEAGFVLNDYVDREVRQQRCRREYDKGTWRVFKTRPLPAGFLSSNAALTLFFLLVALTILLIATLPFPHSLYLIVTIYCYSMEYFYQIKKRHQRYPIAQLLGRTDFALFPVAGYLTVGHPDVIACRIFFFYPFALAHLAVNDLADVKNDTARGLSQSPG